MFFIDCNFIKKETLAQVFSCDFCEISKNTFFTEHLGTTASVNHNFDNCINPSHTCTQEIESTTHFFLHCHFYRNIRKTLLDDLNVINFNISNFSETALTDLLLYGKSSFDKIQNKKILTASIKYIVDSERFTGSIF